MLQVKSQEKSSGILHEDAALAWHEITGKELNVVARENGTTHDINLELKQDGRKTPAIVLSLASIEIPEEVVVKYADEPLLAETISNFAFEQYRANVERISRLMNLVFESRRMIDLTAVRCVSVQFSVRVERDDQDEIVSEAVIATVGQDAFVYSNAGVFDPEG